MISAAKFQKDYAKELPGLEIALKEITEKINKAISANSIKIHSVKTRIKTFESAFNKVKLKKYSLPMQECTDLIGCRIICLFKEQLEEVAKLLSNEFSVKEIIKPKISADRFAYQHFHVIIVYKNIPCEIQLRTIVQESWAELEHYLNYQHGFGTDESIARRINALSALFEVADDEFQRIYGDLRVATQNPETSNKTLSAQTIYQYCKNQFSWAWKNQELFSGLEDIGAYAKVLDVCKTKRINTLAELDACYQKSKDKALSEEEFHVKEILSNPKQWPGLFERVSKTKHFYSPAGLLLLSISEV